MGVDWFHCFFSSFSENDSFLASSKFLNSEKWYHGSNRPWCLGYRYFCLKTVPGFKKKQVTHWPRENEVFFHGMAQSWVSSTWSLGFSNWPFESFETLWPFWLKSHPL